ncbi:MAG TPA: hypothetical protein VK568_11945 [Thermodesulfobacteriota bacterium]|jgi:hypothetical protein|nr:hypothetical protein [Thermodesulfobacteriota bacterium]
MVAYEIYEHDPVNGYGLLGVLPERRRNPARITKGSIVNWGMKFFEKNIDINGISLTQLEIDINTGKTFRSAPSFVTQSRNLDAILPEP